VGGESEARWDVAAHQHNEQSRRLAQKSNDKALKNEDHNTKYPHTNGQIQMNKKSLVCLDKDFAVGNKYFNI